MDRTNYHWGVIGNCQSAAIIDRRGDFIWLCLPDFDSSSVFASMLDENRGGFWGVRTEGEWKISQRYIPRTNILVTRYERSDIQNREIPDIFEIHDFMPRYRHTERTGAYFCPPEVNRYLKWVSGTPVFTVHYQPRLVFGCCETVTKSIGKCIKSWSVKGAYESVYLYTDLPFTTITENEPVTLSGDAFMILSYHQKIMPQNLDRIYLMKERTKVYWLDFVDRIPANPTYRDEVIRSALVLKMMTFQGSGAVLAALTTSLPETIGAQRNWDYRYCWLRDASMTVAVFADLNIQNTVRKYLKFILSLVSTKDQNLGIMYGIRGEKILKEKTIDHLAGYCDSRPVRIGNAAYSQRQHDVYGILLDVILKSLKYLDFKYDDLENIWTIVRMLVRRVMEVWKLPDNGIWEFRKEKRHFVFSKVMCWVAMDRGIAIALYNGMDELVGEWSAVRDTIRDDIQKKGWNDSIGAYTQCYQSGDLDASNLLLEYYGFIDASDPRFVSTVKKTHEKLLKNGLSYRYKSEDDFGQPESAFTVCTLWQVYALHRIGLVKEAREIFENVLALSNEHNLLSEDINFDSGRLLGNFPQAYSHLALITCAALLNQPEQKQES